MRLSSAFWLIVALAGAQVLTCCVGLKAGRARPKARATATAPAVASSSSTSSRVDESEIESLARSFDLKDLEKGDDFDEIRLCQNFGALQHQDQVAGARSNSSSVRRVAGAIWQKAKSAFNRVVESPTKYASLLMRARRWFNEYSLLTNANANNNLDDAAAALPAPVDLLKHEFAQADHDVVSGLKFGDKENVDLLYKIFVRTLERLEKLTKQYKDERTRQAALDIFDTIESEESKRRYATASGRLRRVTKDVAVSAIQNEVSVIARIMILDALATVLADHPELTEEYGAAGMFAGLLVKLGAAHTPLIASYLTNIKFRTALYLLDPIRPISAVMQSCSSSSKPETLALT